MDFTKVDKVLLGPFYPGRDRSFVPFVVTLSGDRPDTEVLVFGQGDT